MIEKTLHQLNSNPKNLFLVDAIGALLSAFLLGIVLVQFESFFGIPRETLYILAIIPCFFSGYDLMCYFRINKNLSPFLKGIAYANILYCGISLAFAFYHYHEITIWGWCYILSEVVIVLILAGIEIKVGNLNRL